ncbi:MAG: hypothetical protein RL621_1762 [Bacteroidota bacterium]|jgi:hypothetical protein
MGQFITLPELIGILIICLPVIIIGAALIKTIKDNSNNNQ